MGVLVVSFQNCSGFTPVAGLTSLSSSNGESGSGGGGSTFTPPPLPVPSEVGQYLTYLTIKNVDTAASTEQYMTVGQVFAPGEVPAGQFLAGKIGGVDVPLQLDKKATHADGSLRHGIITFKAPALPANGGKNLKLYTAASALSGAALSFQNLQSTNYDVTISGTFKGVAFSVSSKGLVAPKNWLAGPLATEFNGSLPINEFLEAYFDIRLYQDGTIKSDVIIANDWAEKTGVVTFNYDVTLTQNGQVVYTKAAQKHNRFSNWKKTLYSAARSKLQVVREPIHFRKTKAILNYDMVPKSEAVIASVYSDFMKSPRGPNEGSMIARYMPMTGGRADIGPETLWTAMYLIHQDPRLEEVILGLADAGGSIPWHYRSPTTKRPVTRDEKPQIWLDDRCYNDCPVDIWTIADTEWATDTAHQPSLFYIPYMITGDRYYLDQLQMQATETINMYNIGYFNMNGKFYFNSGHDQTRGAAWSMRTAINAAYLSPDGDPIKTYLNKIIDNDFESAKIRLIMNDSPKQGELVGYMTGYGFDDVVNGGTVGPWQDDFMTIVYGYAYQRGYQKAKDFLEWKENFTAGRFLQPDSVFCVSRGPGYYYKLFNNGVRVTTWKDLYTTTYGSDPCPSEMEGYPYAGGGYTAIAYAANGILAQYGLTKAQQAVAVIKSRSTFSQPANVDGFLSEPTFAVSAVPVQSLVLPPEPAQ